MLILRDTGVCSFHIVLAMHCKANNRAEVYSKLLLQGRLRDKQTCISYFQGYLYCMKF